MNKPYPLITIIAVIFLFSYSNQLMSLNLKGECNSYLFSYSEASAQESPKLTKGQTKQTHQKLKSSAKKNSKFIYQVKTGECLNSKGEKGLNAVNINMLFDGLDEAQLSSPNYQPKQVYKDKDAECTDLSNFDFNRIIKLSYVRLENWNLKGSNLNGAAFAFAKMIDAELQGAKLSSISIGYTYISGEIDQFSEYPKVCNLSRPRRDKVTQRIQCEL